MIAPQTYQNDAEQLNLWINSAAIGEVKPEPKLLSKDQIDGVNLNLL